MAKYVPTTWVDEVLAGAERYDISEDDGTPIEADARIELSTTVTIAGTPVDADELNNIEDGIVASAPHAFSNAEEIMVGDGDGLGRIVSGGTEGQVLKIVSGEWAAADPGGAVIPVTLSTGTFAVVSSGVYEVAAESGVTDDIDDMTGGVAGVEVWLKADGGDTITVKHLAGKILLMGDRDFVLTGPTMLLLRYNGTDWYQIGGSGKLGEVVLTLGGSDVPIVDESYADFYVAADFYILGWYIRADQSGDVDTFLRSAVWNSVFDAGDDITTANPPALSTAQFGSDTTLTGWTRLVPAGNGLELKLDGAASSITQFSCTLVGIWMP